jgi:hypothetical protein
MTEKELNQQIELSFQQLELARLYEKYFLEKIGKRKYFEMIDIALDRLIFCRKELKKLKNKDK